MVNVQIFGLKKSKATRAAERFFKERRVRIQFVDLSQRAMAPAEIKRFAERFGMANLIDREGKPHAASGMQYLRLSDTDLLGRIGRDPALLRLPLVRSGNRLTVGDDPTAWAAILEG